MIGNGNCLIIGTDAYKAGEDCLKELFKKGKRNGRTVPFLVPVPVPNPFPLTAVPAVDKNNNSKSELP